VWVRGSWAREAPVALMPSHRGAVSRRPFTVQHQKVVLRIDAAQCLVSGFTDLTLECLEDFRELRLHCRQMRVLAVHADGVPTRFDMSDPLLRVVPAGTAVSAEVFDKHFGRGAVHHSGTTACRKARRLQAADPPCRVCVAAASGRSTFRRGAGGPLLCCLITLGRCVGCAALDALYRHRHGRVPL
jgi:hypothetical protein